MARLEDDQPKGGLTKIDKWQTFRRRKFWKVTHSWGKTYRFLWRLQRRAKIARQKPLKTLKNAIFGPFDKWPTSNFRKSIGDPTFGHPPSNRASIPLYLIKGTFQLLGLYNRHTFSSWVNEALIIELQHQKYDKETLKGCFGMKRRHEVVLWTIRDHQKLVYSIYRPYIGFISWFVTKIFKIIFNYWGY